MLEGLLEQVILLCAPVEFWPEPVLKAGDAASVVDPAVPPSWEGHASGAPGQNGLWASFLVESAPHAGHSDG